MHNEALAIARVIAKLADPTAILAKETTRDADVQSLLDDQSA